MVNNRAYTQRVSHSPFVNIGAYLSCEVEQVEYSNENHGHPATKTTTDDFRLYAGKQTERDEVSDCDG